MDKRNRKHAIKSYFLINHMITKKYDKGKTGRYAEMFLRELENRDKQNRIELDQFLNNM